MGTDHKLSDWEIMKRYLARRRGTLKNAGPRVGKAQMLWAAMHGVRSAVCVART